MAKTLQIIQTGYRAALGQGDDPIVWLTHALGDAGAEQSVLLRGSAVSYAVKGQSAAVSGGEQTQGPRLAEDIANLLARGVDVYVVLDDLEARGIQKGELISGPKIIERASLPKLLDRFDRVWQW